MSTSASPWTLTRVSPRRHLMCSVLVVPFLVSYSASAESSFAYESRALTKDELAQGNYVDKLEQALRAERAESLSAYISDSAHSTEVDDLFLRPDEAPTPWDVIGKVREILIWLDPGESNVTPLGLAEAMPRGAVNAFDITDVRTVEGFYTKRLKSLLGLDLVRVDYALTANVGGRYQGKGAYVSSLSFVPLQVALDPLWSVEVKSVSTTPINRGTADAPISAVSAALTFRAKSVFYEAIAGDRITVSGNSQALEASVGAFPE